VKTVVGGDVLGGAGCVTGVVCGVGGGAAAGVGDPTGAVATGGGVGAGDAESEGAGEVATGLVVCASGDAPAGGCFVAGTSSAPFGTSAAGIVPPVLSTYTG